MTMERWGIVALSVAAIVIALGTAEKAHAGAIGVSIDTMANFSPSGFSTEANPNSTASDNAVFNAISNSSGIAICPGAGPCNGGGLSANPLQSTAGPGPFPAQDTYTQPPAGGFTGSRGDANVTSVTFTTLGGGAQNVAETRLTAGNTGSGAGTNHLSTTLNLGFGTPALGFSFTADPYLQVAVTQATGESATAILAMSVTVVNSAGVVVFRWTPGVSAGEIGVATETDPFSLNQTLTATSPAGNLIFDPASATFRATSVALAGEQAYTLNIDMSEITRASSAAVPEPSALLLLGSGLAGLIGTVAWRAHRGK